MMGVLAVLAPVIAVLWPDPPASAVSDGRTYVQATLSEVSFEGCEAVTDEVPCGRAVAVIDGTEAQVEVLLYRDAWFSETKAGDAVILFASMSPQGDGFVYSYHSPQRGPMMLLFGFAALVVVGLGIGRRGVRALCSLAMAALFIWVFLVGGIAAGGSPLLYTAVSAMFVLTVVLFFTHGLSTTTLAAWLGTVTGVGIAVLLGWWMSSALRLGAGDATAQELSRSLPGLDLPGLALGALVLVLIGVLNDISAAQASTVFSHAASICPDDNADVGGWRRVLRSSLAVGRDHASSAVYTVVFSVLGAGLAAFVLASTFGVDIAAFMQSDAVATTVVQVLAGIIGTVVAMPVTTVFAVVLARRYGVGSLAMGYAHVH